MPFDEEDRDPHGECAHEIAQLRAALTAAEACLDALDPRQASGMSDAETASLFNATREQIRVLLNSYR